MNPDDSAETANSMIQRILNYQGTETEIEANERDRIRSRLNQSKTNQRVYCEDQSELATSPAGGNDSSSNISKKSSTLGQNR